MDSKKENLLAGIATVKRAVSNSQPVSGTEVVGGAKLMVGHTEFEGDTHASFEDAGSVGSVRGRDRKEVVNVSKNCGVSGNFAEDIEIGRTNNVPVVTGRDFTKKTGRVNEILTTKLQHMENPIEGVEDTILETVNHVPSGNKAFAPGFMHLKHDIHDREKLLTRVLAGSPIID